MKTKSSMQNTLKKLDGILILLSLFQTIGGAYLDISKKVIDHIIITLFFTYQTWLSIWIENNEKIFQIHILLKLNMKKLFHASLWRCLEIIMKLKKKFLKFRCRK